MGTVFGNSAGRANIVWFEGSSDLPVSSVANTTNTKVIYSLRTSDGALLSYIPGLPDSLQGFTDFSSSKGYWIIALNDYDIPGIIERTGVNNLVGDFTLADFEGNIAALEDLVATVLSNNLQGNFQLSDFSGAVALQETTPEALTALNIEFPQSFQTFQYENAKGTGEIRVKGTYIPSTAPATIRVRYGTDDWQTIGTGSNGNFDLIYVGSPGQKDFQVSTTQNESLIETINTVGIGEVLLIAGDSWASGRIPMSEMIRYIVSGLDAARRFILTYLNNDEKWVQYDENVALDEPVGQSSGEVSFDRSATEARSFSAMRSHWEHMAQLLVAQLDPPRPVAFQVNARGGSTAGIASDSTTGVPSGGVSTASWLPNPNNRKDRTTLYGSMLARFQDDSGNTKCRAVLAHLGTNDVLTKEGPADNAPPTESPENFKADLIALGNAIAADFNCPLFVPILEDLSDSGRFQATTIDAGETQPRYIVFQQKMREAVAEDNNVYSGGDLSGIKPDSADGIHIVTAALGEQMAQIWANALINPLEGREAGTNAVTGSFALSDFEGTVTAEQTQEIAVRGDFALSDFEGVVTSEEIDFNQQLLDKAVALWQFTGTDRTQFIDEKNNIVLQVVGGNDEIVGGEIAAGTTINDVTPLDFKGDSSVGNAETGDGTRWLKIAADTPTPENLLPQKDNKRTYVFWAKLRKAASTDRSNFFSVWESNDSSNGFLSFDTENILSDTEGKASPDDSSEDYQLYRWFIVGQSPARVEIVNLGTEVISNFNEWFLYIIEWQGSGSNSPNPDIPWTLRTQLTIKNNTKSYNFTPPILYPTRNAAKSPPTEATEIRDITSARNRLRIGNAYPGWDETRGRRVFRGELGPFYIFDGPLTSDQKNYIFNNGIPRLVSATLVPKINVQGSFALADFDGTVTSEESEATPSTLQNDLFVSWSLTANSQDISGNDRHLIAEIKSGDTAFTYDATNGVSYANKSNGSRLRLLNTPANTGTTPVSDIWSSDAFTVAFVFTLANFEKQNWIRIWDVESEFDGFSASGRLSFDYTTDNPDRFRCHFNGVEYRQIRQSVSGVSNLQNKSILMVMSFNKTNGESFLGLRASDGNWITGTSVSSASQTMATTISPLYLGSWNSTATAADTRRYPNGFTKWVNIWQRFLTSDERDELFNGGNFLTYPFSS